MSFILDALKKSEHERQRQSVPGLVESSVVRPRPRLPLWAVTLCLLLGVNLVVLLAVLIHGWAAQAPRDAPAAAPSSTAAAREAVSSEPAAASSAAATRAPRDEPPPSAGDQHFSPLDSAPVYAPEIAVPSPAPAIDSRQPATQSPANATSHTVRHHEPVLNEEDFKAGDEEVLPSINELNLTGAQALPELHLDVHVFATRPAERFVFINMRKYHEGATLQEGPTIERIRRDGVILDYHGVRFLLPRQ